MPSFIPLKHLAGYLNASRKKLILEPSIFPSKKSRLAKKVSQPLCELPPLSDALWAHIASFCGPFDLLRMRRVSRQLNRVVDSKLEQILYLDVIMCNLDDILSVDADDDGEFFRHPKSEILLHLSERSAILVVDEKWSSKDVQSLWAALQMFRHVPHNVMIDAQVAEMLVAALAGVKLSRWHTFEAYTRVCSLQDVPSLHMKCGKTASPFRAKWPFFSCAKELTIRCASTDIAYVARLGDYGVGPNTLVPESVELVRLSVVEMKPRSRDAKAAKANRPNRQVALFRRWIRADQLLEKYCQQYS
uniref:F-box domain-containing protein n=1 Tax=Steinernema glaseri TaxID=37863 RepID=A0A1I8AI09_9BILA